MIIFFIFLFTFLEKNDLTFEGEIVVDVENNDSEFEKEVESILLFRPKSYEKYLNFTENVTICGDTLIVINTDLERDTFRVGVQIGAERYTKSTPDYDFANATIEPDISKLGKIDQVTTRSQEILSFVTSRYDFAKVSKTKYTLNIAEQLNLFRQKNNTGLFYKYFRPEGMILESKRIYSNSKYNDDAITTREVKKIFFQKCDCRRLLDEVNFHI